MKRISLLGATGSIGTSCLDVIRTHPDTMQLWGCSCHSKWKELAQICHEFKPQIAIIGDERVKADCNPAFFPAETKLLFGSQALPEICTHPAVDTVVSAIVGAAGLHSSWETILAGKRLAIANKETLVIAGHLIIPQAKKSQSELLPVDSEHSALFQCMMAGKLHEIDQAILTASGGPFRTKPLEEFAAITPEAALAHPTWNMGAKITIDSATMMNKGLEIIEACWLFNIPSTKINVAVHPQSIIHSLVEFQDGSLLAQLSPPDMRLPIQYAITYPYRLTGPARRLNLQEIHKLELFPPDFHKFPCLKLGFEVAERKGSAGVVLNAANEVAVERFLAGSLNFTDIPRLISSILDRHQWISSPDLTQLLEFDTWTRQQAYHWKP